jgi:diadenosine tetraphosphate (Ap4A) HIT family hydrolase
VNKFTFDAKAGPLNVNNLTAVPCELCNSAGGATLWQDALCRVILVEDRDFPGYCRVVLNEHVSEMTDLNAANRRRLMDVVFATEDALREVMQPEKINLASLGNMVRPLHWHVIARFADDRNFPGSVWSEPQRPGLHRSLDRATLERALHARLQAISE